MSNDATQVTGSPLSGDGAQPGHVLAERYELLESLDADGPTRAYRGVDHETERPVLVRMLGGAALDETVLAEVIDRVEGLVGVGGRYLSSLLDVDREGRRPFTIEAWPSGTQLSSILESRRVRGEALGPREVLPVIARLNAALGALPDPWPHGDVRAEHVWVDTDGLRLTGSFLLSALPPQALADRIAALGPGSVVYAPELGKGLVTTAADRWGAAAIAWEALTSRAPDPTSVPSELPTPLRLALRQLLDVEPRKRPRDLTELLSALAQHAGLPVPALDPESHRPPAADIGRPPADRTAPARPLTRRQAAQVIAGSELPREETVPIISSSPARIVAPRKIEGAAAEGTQEISFDQIMEERSVPDLDPRLVRAARTLDARGPDPGSDELAPEKTDPDTTGQISVEERLDPRLVRAALAKPEAAKKKPKPPARDLAGDSLDPDLVQAALGVTLESDDDRERLAGDSLDPALVHAALGVTLDSSDEQEVSSTEIEIVPPKPSAKRPAARPPTAGPTPVVLPAAPPVKPLPSERPPTRPADRPPTARATGTPSRPAPTPRPIDAPAIAEAPPARPAARPPTARPISEAPRPAPAPKPIAEARPAPAPRPIAEAPRPMPAPQPIPEARPAPRPISEAPRPMPAPRPISDPPKPLSDPPRAISDRPPAPAEGGTVVTRPEIQSPKRRPKRTIPGVLIVLGALLVAAAIMAVAFYIVDQRNTEARERLIQERMRQLRDTESAPPDPASTVDR